MSACRITRDRARRVYRGMLRRPSTTGPSVTAAAAQTAGPRRACAGISSDLYAGPDDPAHRRGSRAGARRARALRRATPRRRRASSPPSELAARGRRARGDREPAARAGAYAGLLFAADTSEPRHGALLQRVQERGSEIRNELLFFELEWVGARRRAAPRAARGSGARARAATSSARCAATGRTCSPSPRRGCSRRRPTPGAAPSRALRRGGGGAALPGDGAPARRASSARRRCSRCSTSPSARCAARRRARSPRGCARTRALLALHLQHARAGQGGRRPPAPLADPMAARHLANEIDAAQRRCAARRLRGALPAGRALLPPQGAPARPPAARRLRPLRADRREGRARAAWTRRARSCSAAYRDFSPRWRRSRGPSSTALDRRRAAAGQARRRLLRLDGAQRAPLRAAQLHRQPARRDDARPRARPRRAPVAGARARALRAGHAAHPAETASVFGEMLVFRRLLREERDPAVRLALLCGKLEDAFATVFRQVAMTRFEQALHAARRARGRAAGPAHERALAGREPADVRRLGRAHRRLRLVVALHPALRALALLLLRLRLRRAAGAGAAAPLRRGGRPPSCRATSSCSRAGGSDAPRALLSRVGLDVADPGFWDGGLALLEELVAQAEALAG